MEAAMALSREEFFSPCGAAPRGFLFAVPFRCYSQPNDRATHTNA